MNLKSCLLILLLVAVVLVVEAAPRKKKGDSVESLVIDANRPTSSNFYDHLMGNLQNSNQFVHLAMLPQGVPPPGQDDDYEDTVVPHAYYAFVNPALTGEKVPHWTETLENLKNNPLVPTEVKDKVVQLHGPVKIYGEGTESKFPLLVEYFVQRIQNYFSHYVYEDMSRPSSWDAKVNASDAKPSAEKEPITDHGKVVAVPGKEPTLTFSADEPDIDYIVDFTVRPDIDDIKGELTDEDFDQTTEEWEAPGHHQEKGSNSTEASSDEQKVVVVHESVDLKVVHPISVEDDHFLYVGDGNGEELTRSHAHLNEVERGLRAPGKEDKKHP